LVERDPRIEVQALLRRALVPPSACNGYLIGLSGGRDSMLLLHAIHTIVGDQSLRAVHVHHRLNPAADEWVEFCVHHCQALGIELQVLFVNARPPRGESTEAWARQERYAAFAALLRAGEVLLTAHHESDQAETILLQLLRGAGPAGLAAMPAWAQFGSGWHARPLLSAPTDLLAAYAAAAGLKWVEDSSNTDERFDRNFLRQRIMPVLQSRWPSATQTIARAAQWQAEAVACLREFAAAGLPDVVGSHAASLSICRLIALPEAQQRLLLRAWLEKRGFPLPDAHQMTELLRLLRARPDSSACVRWTGTEIRRYGDGLYVMAPLPSPSRESVNWQDLRPLRLSYGTLSLRPVPWSPDALSAQRAAGGLVVRFRDGGERCRTAVDGPSHAVKQLLQQWRVPTWLRPGLPLIYGGDELLAIGGRTVASSWRAQPHEDCVRLFWEWGRAITESGAIARES
jgi:tRNA(Ile)-lysidine synthase